MSGKANESNESRRTLGELSEVNTPLSTPPSNTPSVSIDPLLELPLEENDFENILLKQDYVLARTKHLQDNSEPDAYVAL